MQSLDRETLPCVVLNVSCPMLLVISFSSTRDLTKPDVAFHDAAVGTEGSVIICGMPLDESKGEKQNRKHTLSSSCEACMGTWTLCNMQVSGPQRFCSTIPCCVTSGMETKQS